MSARNAVFLLRVFFQKRMAKIKYKDLFFIFIPLSILRFKGYLLSQRE